MQQDILDQDRNVLEHSLPLGVELDTTGQTFGVSDVWAAHYSTITFTQPIELQMNADAITTITRLYDGLALVPYTIDRGDGEYDVGLQLFLTAGGWVDQVGSFNTLTEPKQVVLQVDGRDYSVELS